MKAENLKIGSIIEKSIDGKNFNPAVIKKVSDKFVWFNGSGFNRIAKTTIDKYDCFYRIVKI
jgi:hypothetical protein